MGYSYIFLYDLINDDRALNTEQGGMVFKSISSCLERKSSVAVCFVSIRLVSIEFLQSAIGPLYGRFDKDFLSENLFFDSISTDDLVLVGRVIENAVEYFKGKEMSNDFYDDEKLTLWLGAFRYYLGRMTYAVSDFCELLIKQWETLPERTKALIKKELAVAIREDDENRLDGKYYPGLGHDCDRHQWLKVRDFIQSQK